MWKKLALTVVAVLGVAAAPALANAEEPCAPVVQNAAWTPVARPVYARERREDYLRWRQRESWNRARRVERFRERGGYGRRW